MKKIVILGGGTGLSTLLRGLKYFLFHNITPYTLLFFYLLIFVYTPFYFNYYIYLNVSQVHLIKCM